jgi:hypothetical protein
MDLGMLRDWVGGTPMALTNNPKLLPSRGNMASTTERTLEGAALALVYTVIRVAPAKADP